MTASSGQCDARRLFAQRRRLVDPRHWRFLLEVLGLLRRARRDVGTLGDESLDDYLVRMRVSREVRERFVVPLAAALWSLAPDRCGEFPAVSYFEFLDQHGMLSPLRPLPGAPSSAAAASTSMRCWRGPRGPAADAGRPIERRWAR